MNVDWDSRQQIGNQKKSSWVPAFTPLYCLPHCWLSVTNFPWSCHHVFPIKVDCNSGHNNHLFVKLLISYVPTQDWKKLVLVKCAENWAGRYDISDLICKVCFFTVSYNNWQIKLCMWHYGRTEENQRWHYPQCIKIYILKNSENCWSIMLQKFQIMAPSSV